MFTEGLYKDGVIVTCPNCYKYCLTKKLDEKLWSCKGCKSFYVLTQ